MPRLPLTLALSITAVAAVGCGSTASSGIDASTATAAVQKAAAVKLVQQDVPDDARKQGLKQIASNATTAAADKQIVFVITLKDAETVAKLGPSLKGIAGGGLVKLLPHENVLVLYGATGNDHASAVKAAVDAL